MSPSEPPAADDLRILAEAGLHLSRAVMPVVRREIGLLQEVTELDGGVVHRVVRLRGGTGTLILKHRGSVCHRLPSAPTDPGEIRWEAEALRVLQRAAPGLVPDCLAEDRRNHTLVLSDVAAPGLSPGDRWFGEASPADLSEGLTRVFARLGDLHRGVRTLLGARALRPDGDEAFFGRNVFERIGFLGPDARALVGELESLPRQIILGDVSPKNMFIGPHAFVLYDFEHVHRGPVVFDIAFLCAHVLLHRLDREAPDELCAVLRKCLAAYGASAELDGPSWRALGPATAAVTAYRLRNPVVPYRLPWSAAHRGVLADVARSHLAGTDLDGLAGALGDAHRPRPRPRRRGVRP